MTTHPVIQLFHQSIEAKMASGEQLATPLASAAQLAANRLLDGKKVLSCGLGLSASLAVTLTECLVNPHRLERPGFPALYLDAAGAVTHRLRALAQPGDLLVIFSIGNNAGNLVQALQTAQDRDMSVLAFTAQADIDIAGRLTSKDIELRVDNDNPYRVHEIHLLSVFCLCELIEQQLFGG